MSDDPKGDASMIKKIGWVILVGILSVSKVYAADNAFVEGEKVQYGQDTVHQYEHQQTGLDVVWIENKDKNTTFTLGVRTPTKDSTGVNHIIEHSVFTGSAKYPSASLFFDANSTYPHIYMNASTSADLTLYPFCTPYKECFDGLLEVYLDSIFHPDMLNQPSNFYEESFYYDPTTEKYGGVVFNEMKGANGNVGRTIFKTIRQNVYENTHYANDSGGDPKELPSLSYEEFVETYKTNYYPGNMMIVLYGDLPINKTLKTIDGYLTDFTEVKEGIDINAEPTRQSREVSAHYPSQGEAGFLIKSYLITQELSSEQQAELDLWVNTYLLEPNSYFMTKLREKGINNIEMFKDGDLKYPIYSMIVSNIPASKVDQAQEILDSTLEEMKTVEVEEKETEYNTIERVKLSVYQGDKASTRGISIAQSMISAWAHEGERDEYYKVKDYIAKMDDIQNSYKDILLGSEYVTDIKLFPTEPEEAVSPLEISPVKADEWSTIVQDMRAWQASHQESNLQEVKLKNLVLDNQMKYKKKVKNDITYTMYPSHSDLVSTELYLPTGHITQEDLPYLFLYPIMLSQAAREISPFEGMLAANALAIDNKAGYDPYMKISIVTSKQNTAQDQFLAKARESLLAKEDAWYQYQLDNYIGSFISDFQSDIIGTLSYLNMSGQEGSKRYLYEKYYPLYQLCLDFKRTGNNDWIEEIKKIDSEIGPSKGAYVGIAGDEEVIKSSQELWTNYCIEHRLEDQPKEEYTFSKNDQTNIYYKQTDVDYLVYSYDKGSTRVDGLDYLAASYITKNYLQPNIRVKKGAYGSSMNASFPNTILIYTYRDPEYQTSIDIINNMVPILKAGLTENLVEIAKSDAICDVQNQFGMLSTDMKKASILQILMIMGVDVDYVVDMQKQIIKSDMQDINKQLDVMDTILKNSSVGICTNKATVPTQSETRIFKLK